MLDTGATAAGGNIFGGFLNYEANKDFQERQFREQEKMQERSFQMNEQAVRNQARNMAYGLESAGLNPAMVGNGGGAPTTATGSAASGTAQLSQVFTGIAELVQAMKAPTEIEKTAAETGLIGKQEAKTEAETTRTGYETQQVIKNIDKIQADAKKVLKETQNIQNINDMFESERDFLKNNSGGIFQGYIGQLKATKQWENLPTKTKMTLESLAEGDFELDQGALNALDKIINTQGNLSERDKQVMLNTKDMIVTYNQIKDRKVIDAITKMPLREQEKIIQECRKIKAEVNNLREQNKNLKKQRVLMTKQGAQLESQARKNNSEREIMELNDMQWLIDHDRWGDAARLGTMRTANDLWDTGREGAKEVITTRINPAAKVGHAFKNFK